MAEDQTISEKTKLPLSLVIVLVAGVVTLAAYAIRIDARLARIEQHIPADWTLSDQRSWALEMQVANPTVKVPAVEKKP